ncbi:hypothetical protein ABBQ32_000299 [Trebouxia sp. C0010 RCD-2024]
MVEAESAKSYQEQGNEFYKAELWLKAAACYTKGIKEEPEKVALYSNRSAALLKLQKAVKALADAETCIRLKPEWEKGHYRKAMVLETMGELSQALASYEQAAKLQSTAEFKLKIASLKKQIQREKAGGGKVAAEKENRGKPASNFAFADGRRDTDNTGNNKASKVLAAPNVGEIRNDADYAEAKKGMASGEPIPLTTQRIQQFGQDIIAAVQQQMTKGVAIQPSVYFLPGKQTSDGQTQMGQVQISTAFESPDLLQNCLSFLRQYATDMGAHAACAVVPKKAIAYPQVWKMKGWPHQISDGIFVQLESSKPLRSCWFIPLDDKQPQETSNDYKILEPIFK